MRGSVSKIKVMAVVSFEQVRKGDIGEVEYTPRIKALISMGYLRRVDDVRLPSGPVPDKSRISRSSKAGNGGGVPGSNESGEDTGPGGHGPVEVIDQVSPETGDT